jgi:hypothetical protein
VLLQEHFHNRHFVIQLQIAVATRYDEFIKMYSILMGK